jgi:hypothetical protein
LPTRYENHTLSGRPFSRLAALSNGSISPASPAVTRLARHENDSPSGATAFNQHFSVILRFRFAQDEAELAFPLAERLNFS